MRFPLSLITALAALPLLNGASPAQTAEDMVRPAKVHMVVETETELRRVYPGIALPSKEVELSFRVSGRVIELPVRASMNVEKDAIIAQLDTRDFEARVAELSSQREQALAELQVLRTGARPEEIAVLESAVQAAEARLDEARDQFDRTRQLAERGVVATAQLEQREVSLRVATAQLETELERLAIGRAGGRPEEIAAAEAALKGLEARLQLAENDLADTALRAPFGGIIARRDIENFSNVQAGQPVVLMQDLSTVDVVFDLPGTDITAILATGAVNVVTTVAFDAIPGQGFETELVEFSTQADAATQTYRGRVSVTLPKGAVILPGMVARVITTAPRKSRKILTVPLSALGATPDGSSFVWQVNLSNNTVSRQAVTLGEVSGDGVSVTEGLNPGDVVVSAGVSQLQEGMKIRPVTKIGG